MSRLGGFSEGDQVRVKGPGKLVVHEGRMESVCDIMCVCLCNVLAPAASV